MRLRTVQSGKERYLLLNKWELKYYFKRAKRTMRKWQKRAMARARRNTGRKQVADQLLSDFAD